jgi:hypothetical protein
VLRFFRTSVVVVLAVGMTASFATAQSAPTSHALRTVTYKKCGVFKFKGKHALFVNRYPCEKAEGKAKYVLRHRHHPPHWKCSLSELSSGFATCHRHRHRWEFVPA